jgi:hypothetical protein
MKVELHLHTRRYSSCSTATPFDLMDTLIRTGYGAVYITEHDAMWADWEIQDLQAEFPAIRIFAGVELTLSWSPLQHLLVLGTSDPAYLEMDDPAAVIHKAREEGHLTIAAHPFRWEGAGEVLTGASLPDAIEYNTCNHSPKQANRSAETAEILALPLVNGGDVHGLGFVNQFWIETERDLVQGDDIRSIVTEGQYVNQQHGDHFW